MVGIVDAQSFEKDMLQDKTLQAHGGAQLTQQQQQQQPFDGSIQDKVTQCSMKLLESDNISKLITQTVRQVARKHNATEDHIKSHIAEAAKQFITKVIDNVFADLQTQQGKQGKHDKQDKQNEGGNNSNDNSNNNNNGVKFGTASTDGETTDVDDDSSNDGRVHAAEAVNVCPMFGDKHLMVDCQLVEDGLAAISVTNDEDLYTRDISKRNSFRNIRRPDISKVSRYRVPTRLEAASRIEEYAKQVLCHEQGMATSGLCSINEGVDDIDDEDDDDDDVEECIISTCNNSLLDIDNELVGRDSNYSAAVGDCLQLGSPDTLTFFADVQPSSVDPQAGEMTTTNMMTTSGPLASIHLLRNEPRPELGECHAAKR